jgi:hypothetical protein
VSATSTGRRGYVGIDRRWLADPNLSDGALRLMLWLDSHTDEFLAEMNITKAAESLGWGRNRAMRTIDELEGLGLVSTEKLARRSGGTVTRFTLHLTEWSDGPQWRDASRHGDASASRHGDAPTTSTHNGEESSTETPLPPAVVGQLDVLEPWEAMFIQFWDSYPRKVAKPAARKSFKTKMSKMTAPQMELMIGGTNAWLAHWELVGTEEQFIPHPATFLNQERYNDHPPQAALPTKQSAVDIIARIAQRDH